MLSCNCASAQKVIIHGTCCSFWLRSSIVSGTCPVLQSLDSDTNSSSAHLFCMVHKREGGWKGIIWEIVLICGCQYLQRTEGTTDSGHISLLFQILLIFGPKKPGFPIHLHQVSRGTQRLHMLKICLFLCGPNFSQDNSIFYFFSQILQVLSCQQTSYPALNPSKNMQCSNNTMEDNSKDNFLISYGSISPGRGK